MMAFSYSCGVDDDDDGISCTLAILYCSSLVKVYEKQMLSLLSLLLYI